MDQGNNSRFIPKRCRIEEKHNLIYLFKSLCWLGVECIMEGKQEPKYKTFVVVLARDDVVSSQVVVVRG